MDSMISWITSAVIYGTVILFGSLGEILTEKSGHLNLGVPGLMFLGGFAAFASAFGLERILPEGAAMTKVLLIVLPLLIGFLAACLGGALYSFFTDVLRANQNVTGLALTSLGVGIGTFGGVYICKVSGQSTYTTVSATSELFCKNLYDVFDMGRLGDVPDAIGRLLLSYGFLTYVAVILALLLQRFFNKTRTGLNLRAIGENPATADAAGVNVGKYKFWSTTLGGGICGLGGLYYVLVYSLGGWTTQNNIEGLGWLAVALVIFATWKPVNAIWGAYLFAFLFWLWSYFPSITGLRFTSPTTDLVKALPYLVTVIVLTRASIRRKKENQPPASLGLPYFREER